MPDSDDLHDLIRSLSPNEKRAVHLRLVPRTEREDIPHVLRLFNALADMAIYDVDELRSRLADHPRLVRNLAQHKRHLKARVFDVLRTTGSPTIDQRIAHAFAEFRIAEDKRLFGLARKRMEKAIDLARQAERLSSELMLLNEYQLFLQVQKSKHAAKNLIPLLDRKDQLMALIVEENHVLDDYFRTMVTYQTHGDSAESRALFDRLRSTPDLAPRPRTTEARRVQAQMQATIHRILKNDEISLAWQERTVEAFQENTLYQERKGEVYALAMLNLMNRYSTPGTEGRFQALRRFVQDEIERLKSDSLRVSLLGREILHGLRTLRFDELGDWIDRARTRLRSTVTVQTIDVNIAYNLALCLFLCERWDEAGRFFHVIIERRGEIRRDTYHHARLIDMICTLELGATEHLHHLIRSYARSSDEYLTPATRRDWLAILRGVMRLPPTEVPAHLQANRTQIEAVIDRLPDGVRSLTLVWFHWRCTDRADPFRSVTARML